MEGSSDADHRVLCGEHGELRANIPVLRRVPGMVEQRVQEATVDEFDDGRLLPRGVLADPNAAILSVIAVSSGTTQS